MINLKQNFFSGLQFYIISPTLITRRAMYRRSDLTLLNDALFCHVFLFFTYQEEGSVSKEEVDKNVSDQVREWNRCLKEADSAPDHAYESILQGPWSSCAPPPSHIASWDTGELVGIEPRGK